MRPLCLHASRLLGGKDRKRNCGHPNRGGTCERKTDCEACPLYAARPENAEPDPPVVQLGVIRRPCVHVGAPAPPPNGLPSSKTFYACEAGKGVVCACQCGPKCDRYEPEGE